MHTPAFLGGLAGALILGRPSSCAARPPYEIAPRGSRSYWLFALFCGIAWVWIYFSVPETKGQSLEQIQQLWMEAGKRC